LGYARNETQSESIEIRDLKCKKINDSNRGNDTNNNDDENNENDNEAR
jgi:hypothetical protein